MEEHTLTATEKSYSAVSEFARRVSKRLGVPIIIDAFMLPYVAGKYQPQIDTIFVNAMNDHIPYPHQVHVLLHELAHATGNQRRLARLKPYGVRFGGPEYSQEEVIAEEVAGRVWKHFGLEEPAGYRMYTARHPELLAKLEPVIAETTKYLLNAGGE